jgi:uncharacterized protein (DUF983 family)
MPVTLERGGPSADASASERPVWPAIRTAARGCCPACGSGRLFTSYLKVVDHCPACNEALHHHRADDAPAYFTMFIVGHVIVGGLLALEKAIAPSTFVQLAIWLPLALVLSLALLPVVKGALVGLQWALRMHGFGPGDDPAAPLPDPAATLAASSKVHRT